jgi:protein O-GlcNAc transferase
MHSGISEPALNRRAQRALELLQQGRHSQAETLCRQILDVQPRHFHALHLLGIMALHGGAASRAVEWFRAAVAADPAQAPAYSNLAAALLAVGQPRESLECCEQALKLRPNFPEALANRGHAERTLLNEQARTLLRMRRPDEALRVLDDALRRAPGFVEAMINRGSALRELQRPGEAMASYTQAWALAPERPDLHTNVANLLLQLGRANDALDACDRALQLQPDLTEALNIRAQALGSLDRLREAAETSARLLHVAPDFDYAAGKLFQAKAAACDWSEHRELTARILDGVMAGKRASTPLSFLAVSDSGEAQLRCARTYVADQYPAAAPLAPRVPYRHGRVRLAYLSSDFYNHPVAYLLAGVLEQHDKQCFETHALSLDREHRGVPMQRRIQNAVEHFHEVSEFSDLQIARYIREREIDILVDLNGHTRHGRLGILAHRPAPLQVGFLGFTGTTGAGFIDYVIGDSIALPQTLDRDFSEQVVRLPHSFLPNDDHQPIAVYAPSRREAGLPDEGFVFCGFNNPYKLGPMIFDVWIRLLREVPGSVLWLKDGEATLRDNLRREAASRSVSPQRLVFAPRIPAMDEHLARYRLADLFLDTLPYGAHATARDALWAGLPVLTCTGNAFAGRVAASLLQQLGLEELVTATLDEYFERALALATSAAALNALRAKLAAGRQSRPLFSTSAYRTNLEAAYATMLARLERGEEPLGFSVADCAAP